ncbi:hypothetical protein CDD81_593 [Ophiocordyceps australis]|uniref:Zn(2)-C6 fungal-type domain-containing protein n=1 Tax=Ophiocordyceps australis TaxID=1399860 RepID=A0A2C5XL06_9HYPO|nr:hypothetical protein CDD81_593 [Ophiocordyceps australis]
MESYAARAPARKLKDSCDLCSASKLRCDKQKPTCARCAGLGQACSYSPARRAGRPHRVRRDKKHFTTPIVSSSGMSEGSRDSDHGSDASPDSYALGVAEANHQHSAAESPWPCLADSGTGDCTRTAISLIQQLSMARSLAAPRRAASSATTDACQGLLKILICPCSEQPGVALLVASGCLSLIDTAQHLLSCQASRDTPSSQVPSCAAASPKHDWARWQGLANSRQSGVAELANIAKVVMQFIARCCQEPEMGSAWATTSWLVAPIAAMLRTRLQSVTDEAVTSLVY